MYGQEYDISTGQLVPVEQVIAEVQDSILGCTEEIIRLFETNPDGLSEEGKFERIFNLNANITFQLRRVKQAIEIEKAKLGPTKPPEGN